MPARGMYGEEFARGSIRAEAAGNRIAGDFYFAFGGNLGDKKALQELHGWRRYWKCTSLCHKCRAVKASAKADLSLNYSIFGDEAAWWATVVSHEQCVAEFDSPFVGEVEGYHIDLDLEDTLHNIYKGHARNAVGSCFGEMLLDGLLFPAGNLEEAMGNLDGDLRLWSRIASVRHTRHRLSVRALGWGKLDRKTMERVFPEMNSWWKAWEMQVLVPFAAHVALERGSADDHGKLRAVCLWGLAEWQHVIHCSGRRLDDDQRRRSKIAAAAYLLAYQKLAADAREAGRYMWHVLPKHHYFAHLARRTWSTGWNPRYESVFMMEDHGGRLARIHRGTHGETELRRLPERYLVGLAARWHQLAVALGARE